jgi:preprotein translocase subunit SecA
VASAGAAGAITVATRMAGRGTDIALDDAARAAGGLHVVNAQCNPSPRLDRQLAGRAARHGDPGSTERLVCRRSSDDSATGAAPTLGAWTPRPPSLPHGPAWLAVAALALWQAQQERQARARRRQLQAEDRAARQRLSFAGSDHG